MREGYSICEQETGQLDCNADRVQLPRTTRADAPNDFGGRFDRNFERTTPELPADTLHERGSDINTIMDQAYRAPA